MSIGTDVASVRQVLGNMIGQLERGSAQPLGEVLLHQDGFYVGRRFEFPEVRAIWFEEEAQIKLYDREGRFLESVQLLERGERTEEPQRSAA